jgi:hypothetical protein
MSVDRTAMIVRGFTVDKETWDNLDDDFRDDWGITFNAWWDNGPYIIGYVVQRCHEGEVYKLTHHLIQEDAETRLTLACESAGIEMPPLGTYFGVAVW